MLDFLKKAFARPQPHEYGGEQQEPEREKDLQIAACALFLEIANIDASFTEDERESILALISQEYGLTREEAGEISRQAESERENSIDLWKFTNLINENYTEAEKIRVVELLWRVVYADGILDKHEDYLVHKLARLLRLKHKHLIDAKLNVLRSFRGD